MDWRARLAEYDAAKLAQRRAERLLADEVEDRAAAVRQNGRGGEGCDGHQAYRMRGSNTA